MDQGSELARLFLAGKAYAGGCLCGRIRYRATGKPSNETHCHCDIKLADALPRHAESRSSKEE